MTTDTAVVGWLTVMGLEVQSTTPPALVMPLQVCEPIVKVTDAPTTGTGVPEVGLVVKIADGMIVWPLTTVPVGPV